ncbi:MAG: hypothetical protein M9898_02820, partial [Chitinophagaceae bacterium]|nr:hypothetical protein [Chitinophagaceae bacterium]
MMKQLILCFLLLAGFTAKAQQLSPNFYNQFKAILNTDWEALKGEGLDEDEDSLGLTVYYKSNKNLDGFELTVMYEENKEGNTTSFDKYVDGENKSNPGNAQLFEKIKTELSKLENEGFKLQKGKNSFDIISGQQAEEVSSRVSLYENKINIRFFKSYILKTVFSNGDVYEGDFRGGTDKTVKGKYTWANGNVYEGDFVGDKRTGKGKFIWANGDVYEGDFVDDKRTGKGKLTGKNGGVYIGDFVDGKFNGKGKLTQKDGKVYEDDFKDGKFLGSANTTSNTTTTSGIAIPANSSAAVPEPMESKFRTAFNSAIDSKGRGKALGVLFGDVYKNASLSDAQKKSYMIRRVGEVYALDKEAAFKGMMEADCSTKEVTEVLNSLPADPKAFIQKRALEVSSDFKVVKPKSTTTNTTTNTTASTPTITTTPAGEA